MSGRSHRFLGITSTFEEQNVLLKDASNPDFLLWSLTFYHQATAPPNNCLICIVLTNNYNVNCIFTFRITTKSKKKVFIIKAAIVSLQ